MLISLASRSRNQGESNQAIPPKIFNTLSIVSSVEYISWVRPCLLSKYKVIICGFRWKPWQSNASFFTDQGNAYLKRNALRFKNLQIAYCVNCRNTNIPGYCCQRSVFCDCYRNTEHFLCSVERIKRLRTCICIASSAMFPLRQDFLIWSASIPRGCWEGHICGGKR